MDEASLPKACLAPTSWPPGEPSSAFMNHVETIGHQLLVSEEMRGDARRCVLRRMRDLTHPTGTRSMRSYMRCNPPRPIVQFWPQSGAMWAVFRCALVLLRELIDGVEALLPRDEVPRVNTHL